MHNGNIVEQLRSEIRILKLLLLITVCLPFALGFQAQAPARQVVDEIETHKLVVTDAAGHRVFEAYTDQNGATILHATSTDAAAYWHLGLGPRGIPTPASPSVAREELAAVPGLASVSAIVQAAGGTQGAHTWWGAGIIDSSVHFDSGVSVLCSPAGRSPVKHQSSPPTLSLEFGGTAPHAVASWSAANWNSTPCS